MVKEEGKGWDWGMKKGRGRKGKAREGKGRARQGKEEKGKARVRACGSGGRRMKLNDTVITNNYPKQNGNPHPHDDWNEPPLPGPSAAEDLSHAT